MKGDSMLAKGFYKAVVESVWPKDGQYGEYWEWNFRVQNMKLKAFTGSNLKGEKTRTFIGAVLRRSVDPTEELCPSYFGGEQCTVEIGTIKKNGREFNTIEKVI
jgi:hypothetical protein